MGINHEYNDEPGNMLKLQCKNYINKAASEKLDLSFPISIWNSNDFHWKHKHSYSWI